MMKLADVSIRPEGKNRVLLFHFVDGKYANKFITATLTREDNIRNVAEKLEALSKEVLCLEKDCEVQHAK